jgi:gamma-butyrobetaine dioxygenase
MQDKYIIKKVSKKIEYVEVTWNDRHVSKYHFLWLRDNCPFAFHKDTRMRNFNILTVSNKICPIQLDYTKEKLNVIWSENNHHSNYDLKWLRNNCYTEINSKGYESPYKLWDHKLINSIQSLTFNHDEIIKKNENFKAWLNVMYSYGFAIVKNSPVKNKSAFKILNLIGGHRETFFGTPFEVINIPKPNNQAYTADALPNHTDLPYYEYVPGYQFLHCLINNADGGYSTAVDGFAVSNYLKLSDKKKFDFLINNDVKFKDNDFTQKNTRINNSPIIKLNKNMDYKEIRINLGAMATLDLKPSIMKDYYDAYIYFYKLLHSERFKIEFKLKAGDIFCFDNRRILHGRTKFDANSGNRHLQGYYIEREEILSKINYLNNVQI